MTLGAPGSPTAIFVDYDGTITDVDTFDVLVRAFAGDAAWDAIEADFAAGRITLREALQREAGALRLAPADALAFLESHARLDPTFPSFVRAARAHGASVCVVSAGIRQAIEPALARAGVDVPVYANDVDFDPTGWRLRFIDDSVQGHDKAARVRAVRAAGEYTIYVGDGISDFEGALAADEVFAKKNRALERFARGRGLRVRSFATFDEIERALFPATGSSGSPPGRATAGPAGR